MTPELQIKNVEEMRKSIMAYENAAKFDPMNNVKAEKILSDYRRHAEAYLIKASIIKKMHYDIALSPLEKEYLKEWKKRLKEVTLIEDADFCLAPSEHTKLKIKDLSAEDLYRLNSIPNVRMTKEFSDFSLHDLIFEMSIFIDPTLIRQV